MKLQRISLSYQSESGKRKRIFHRFSFSFPSQGMVVITGDSGIGKSSLLKLCAKQVKPDQGKVVFSRQDLEALPPILMGDHLGLVGAWKIRDWLTKSQLESFFSFTGMSVRDLNKTYWQLSGGQKARVLLFVILAQPTRIWLLDEPTRDLDLKNRHKIISHLLHHASDHLCIISTHDPDLIAKSHVELKLISPYRVEMVQHRTPASITKNPPLPSRTMQVKTWKRHVIKRHRFTLTHMVLGSLTLLTSFALQAMGFIYLSLHHHEQHLAWMSKAPGFVFVQSRKVVAIANSPFQLVSTGMPDVGQLQQALSRFDAMQMLPDLRPYFPETLSISGTTYVLGFADLPFQKSTLSLAVIGPAITSNLNVTSIPLPDGALVQLDLPLSIARARPVLSWFESPRLLLSYWQWYDAFQQSYAEDRYLNQYQTWSPPSGVLLFHPQMVQLQEIASLLNESPTWDAAWIEAESWQNQSSIIDASQFTLQILGVWLLGLWGLIWWSRFHHVWSQHQSTLLWFKAIHVSTLQVFQWLTHLQTLNAWVMQAILSGLMVGVLLYQEWIPSLSFSQYFALSTIFQIAFALFHHGLRKGFMHA